MSISKNKSILSSVLILIIAITFFISSCVGETTATSALSKGSSFKPNENLTETYSEESTAHEIISKSIAALNEIGSYKLDENMTEAYSVFNKTNPTSTATHWKISKSVNIATKELQMATSVDEDGLNVSSFEVYISDGLMHINQIIPHTYGPGSPYTKITLTDQTWESESQIFPPTELLETSSKANLTGNETVNGIDCYILNITPTFESMINWIISQQQPDGPSIFWWRTGFERSREIYTQAYENSSVKLWIAKDSYLVIKSDVSALFEVTPSILMPGDISIAYGEAGDHGYGFDKITTDFTWQIYYSDYNQPISIKVPSQ